MKRKSETNLINMEENRLNTDTSMASSSSSEGENHHDDNFSMFILMVLYTLQGIPMGLCGSLPVILKARGIGFEGLALLSLASLPFSLKLLWAPIVDAQFLKSMGRRKSWLVPVQLLTGIVFIGGSTYVNEWMDINNPNVEALSAFFIFLYFLMATQDIAVDGWALTMLSTEHVGYASICNSIGQSFGYFLANQGFIALNDEHWCHAHLGTPIGQSLIDLSGFMKFWGIVFIIVTLALWVGKEEKDIPKGDEPDGLLDTYRQVYSIFKLKPIQTLTLILLTARVPFAPLDSAWTFKLMEYGLPKADLATISPLLLIVGLALPAFLSKSVTSDPLKIYQFGYSLKLITSLLGLLALQFCKHAFQETESPSYLFYAPLTALMVVNEIASQYVFIASMAFFSKIADPAIGGTYMTLLNTLSNLGSKWPNTLSLWLLPTMTFSSCVSKVTNEVLNLDCVHTKQCIKGGGYCENHLDGFTLQIIFGFVFGEIWLIFCSKLFGTLSSLNNEDWMIKKRGDDTAMKSL